MLQMLMMPGARKIMTVSVKARPGEKLLVITDPTLMSVAEALAAAGEEAGCETVVSVMRPRAWDGEEPPAVVAEGMKTADIVTFGASSGECCGSRFVLRWKTAAW